jgi:hypothetical protein
MRRDQYKMVSVLIRFGRGKSNREVSDSKCKMRHFELSLCPKIIYNQCSLKGCVCNTSGDIFIDKVSEGKRAGRGVVAVNEIGSRSQQRDERQERQDE